MRRCCEGPDRRRASNPEPQKSGDDPSSGYPGFARTTILEDEMSHEDPQQDVEAHGIESNVNETDLDDK